MEQKQSQNGAQPAAGAVAATATAGGTVAGGAAAQGQIDTITAQTEQTAAAAMPSREDIERAAVLAYERQHGLKDGKPAEGAQPAAKAANAAQAGNGTKDTKGAKEGAEGAPAWAQGVLEAVERLAGRVAEMEQTRVESARREELQGLVARLPEPMRAVYARLPLGGLSEAAWGEEKARVAQEVEGTVQALAAQGVRFAPPQGGETGSARGAEATAEELKAVLARANV